VTFDTPDGVLDQPPSNEASEFRLYANQNDAFRDPRGPTLVYRVLFPGTGGDVGPGSAVLLQGVEVGEVVDSKLQYDDTAERPQLQVTLQIDPSKVEIIHRRDTGDATPSQILRARIDKLVNHGLRAQLTSASFITGGKIISLDLVPSAPPAHVEQLDGYAQLPSIPTTDLSATLASLNHLLHNFDTATAGPALGHAIQELDRTLSNLDQITHDVQPQLKPLLDSLRETADAAQHTLQAANEVLGSRSSSGGDLSRLIRELTDTARSIRALTDYLDRHPESLIRGRKEDLP
jgi:paraquat-inducible protein B